MDFQCQQAGTFRLFNDVAIRIRKLQLTSSRCSCLSSRCRRSSCRSTGCAIGNRIDLLDQLGHIDKILRIPVANIFNHLLQGINAFKDNINDLFIDLQLFLAKQIQQVFHFMGKLSNLGISHSC